MPRGAEGTYLIEVARAAESPGGEYILRLQGASLPLDATLAAAALVENAAVELDEDVASDSTDENLGASAQAVDLAFDQYGDAIESSVDRDLVDDYLDGLLGELAVDSLS